jgi:hypothetical protein
MRIIKVFFFISSAAAISLTPANTTKIDGTKLNATELNACTLGGHAYFLRYPEPDCGGDPTQWDVVFDQCTHGFPGTSSYRVLSVSCSASGSLSWFADGSWCSIDDTCFTIANSGSAWYH